MQRKKHSPKILLAAIAATIGLGALTACNTVKGAGEDVGATGDAISGAAQDTQDEMNK